MRRGEIWVANLNPNRGQEVGKIRPVVVIQDDLLLETALPTVLVLPVERALAGVLGLRLA